MLNLLFGLKGPVDRAPYFLGVTACQLALAALVWLLLRQGHVGVSPLWLLAFAAGALACLWISFALTWKRLHDFEMHGAWAFLMFVPGISVGMYLLFSFLKGDTADPPWRVLEHGDRGPE